MEPSEVCQAWDDLPVQNPTTAHETAVAAQVPYSIDPPYMAASIHDTPVHPTLNVVQGLWVGSANVAAPGAGEQQPQTAVAAAQPAVAPEQSMWTLEMLRSVAQVPNHVSDHNGALKYFRRLQERANLQTKYFHFSDYEQVPSIIKYKNGGEPYGFHPTHRVMWRWSDMLSNLQEQDLQKIVWGPQWRQNAGIVRCELTCEDMGYDHRRDRAEADGLESWKDQTDQNDLWVFVLTRDDGTQVWMKPDWAHPTVKWGDIADRTQMRIEVPPEGRGGRRKGGGLYTEMINKNVTCPDLKFDLKKNEIRGRIRKQDIFLDDYTHLIQTQ